MTPWDKARGGTDLVPDPSLHELPFRALVAIAAAGEGGEFMRNEPDVSRPWRENMRGDPYGERMPPATNLAPGIDIARMEADMEAIVTARMEEADPLADIARQFLDLRYTVMVGLMRDLCAAVEAPVVTHFDETERLVAWATAEANREAGDCAALEIARMVLDLRYVALVRWAKQLCALVKDATADRTYGVEADRMARWADNYLLTDTLKVKA